MVNCFLYDSNEFQLLLRTDIVLRNKHRHIRKKNARLDQRRRDDVVIGKRFYGDCPRASLLGGSKQLALHKQFRHGNYQAISRAKDRARRNPVQRLNLGFRRARSQWTEMRERNRGERAKNGRNRAEGRKRKGGLDALTFDDSINAAHCRRREGEVGERHPSADIPGAEI